MFAKVVGFVLAALFALVMGISMWALLTADYFERDAILSRQSHDTLQIVGYASSLAALVAWRIQDFAAQRRFIARFLFGVFTFLLAFCSFGGLLRIVYSHISYPSEHDWSLSGLYWSSLNEFYPFLLFMLDRSIADLHWASLRGFHVMLLPSHPFGLLLAAGLYLALFGPREPRHVKEDC